MGEQNVDVVARWADAIRRGDLAEELWDANLEIVNAEGWAIEATVGHFRATGIPFDEPWASVITVRAGRIVHAVGYLTKGRALRAFERGPGAA